MVRSLVFFALVAGAIGLVWHGLGQPVPMPPTPLSAGEKLTCISYTPFHGDQSPFSRPEIPVEQIAGDMERLSGLTSCVRTYAASGPERMVPEHAHRHGLKVLQGIWLARDGAENRREIEAALALARRHPETIKALIVGNEALLRGELSVDQIKAYLEEVRTRSGLPVTYADVWEFWLDAPELAKAVDFVTVHILPYWEDEPVAAGEAVAHVRAARRRIEAAFPGKEIWIGEVGWPSAGRMRERALPSPANQARVLSGVVAAAKEEGWKVNLIEAFDQPWKRQIEGTVGGNWGLFDNVEREPKFQFGKPVSNHPHWRLAAALGIGAAFLVFLAAWLGGKRRRPWHEEAAVAGMALASGLLFGWATLKLPQEDILPGDQLQGTFMLVLALVVPMAAAFAVSSGDRLHGFAAALDPSRWRGGDIVTLIIAGLLIATVGAAMLAGLGLVFDPRYKDFPFAPLTGPVVALAILAFFDRSVTPRPGVAEIAAAFVLTGSALFIVANQGIANWQALWFAILLIALALTVLRIRAAPG
ncbi:MAG: beta-1,6-glucan synthase [Methyloceanibacter sp.]